LRFTQLRRSILSAAKRPVTKVRRGDDLGWLNISAYNHGVMGYKTPNIDRIVKEGAMFTDWYGQQSCTVDPITSEKIRRLPLAEPAWELPTT
jgi:hypothetical protein